MTWTAEELNSYSDDMLIMKAVVIMATMMVSMVIMVVLS